jgi:hypothetical protein
MDTQGRLRWFINPNHNNLKVAAAVPAVARILSAKYMYVSLK